MVQVMNRWDYSNVDFLTYRNKRISKWNSIANKLESWKGWGTYYHKRLSEVFSFLIQPGLKVIEFGCGTGDLLSSVNPSFGVGVDISLEHLLIARKKHKDLHFVNADCHDLNLSEKFDIIILSDILNDVWDVQRILNIVNMLSDSDTRVIINCQSHLWEFPLYCAKKMRIAQPTLFQNWLTVDDLRGMLDLCDFEIIKNWEEILWPINTPILANFLNRFLVKLWPFRYGAMTNFIMARSTRYDFELKPNPTVSIVIPARNESGNISEIFSLIPNMGDRTEIIFVEGHSNDNTYEVIQKHIEDDVRNNCKLFRQKGVGKGDAVRLGFEKATGDILMIYDADLTVPPEALLLFFDALVENKGEFANGVRLVYPMENQAMRSLNLIGNKVFSLIFSWLLGHPIKDTLCGTKALWQSDYARIEKNRAYFGDFDPFGDFDLIFGSAKIGLKMIDIPIRYRNRTFGDTNIQRWRHGLLLFRMVLFALRRIKFI